MENSRGKIIIAILVLVVVSVVSALFSTLINTNAKNNSNSTPWRTMKVIPSVIVDELIQPEEVETSTFDEPIETQIPSSTPIPPTDSSARCIHTVIYWADHLEIWPASVNISNLIYSKDDIISIYDKQSGDLTGELFIQVHAAYLNLTNGARNINIEKLILDAANWIVLHPIDSEITDPDQKTGIAFETILADYNNGRIGPDLCEDETIYSPFKEILSPTSESPIESPVFTFTLWPSLIPTRTSTIEPPRRPNPPSPTRQPTLPSTQIPTIVPTTPLIVTQTSEPVLPTPAP